MASELKHVRFRMSDLIQATARIKAVKALSASEALTFYWNWAKARGWALAAMSSRRSSAMVLRIEHGDQFESTHEEHWDIVWTGEDTDGHPDIVEYAGLLDLEPWARAAYLVLKMRGWVEADILTDPADPKSKDTVLAKDGEMIAMQDIQGACTNPDFNGQSISQTADYIEREHAEPVPHA